MSESNQGGEIKGVVTLNADPAVQGFQKVEDAGKKAAQSLEQTGKKAAQALEGTGDAADKAATRAEQAHNRIEATLRKRIALEEAALKGARAVEEARISNRGGDPAKFKPYLDQLDALKDKQRAAAEAAELAARSVDYVGLSSKQAAAALRQVPAQLQDIAVSLQGGQNPFTVMLQQGSQLTTSFGGVGNALKAVGGQLLGLVNPLTATAAGAIAFLLAFEKGAGEQREFVKTLTLTGNAAGLTASQLSEAAAAIDSTSRATQGKAAESLNAFVLAGVKGRDEIQRFTAAAIEFERVGGAAVGKVAENFAKLGKDPLKAALALNEGTNFLTRSIYEQIRALEDEGKATEAAKVAQEAYNSALKDRTPQLLANLGLIERAWLGIKDATKAAADAALNIGRPQTFAEQGDALRQQIAGREARIAGAGFTSSQGGAAFGRGLSGANLAKEQAALEADRQALYALNERARLEQKVAGAKAEQAASVAAAAEWERTISGLLPKQFTLAERIAKLRTEADRTLRGASPDRQQEIEAQFAAAEKKLRADAADKGAAAEAKRGVDAQIEELRRGSAVKAEIAKQEADVRASEFKRGITNELQFIDLEKEAKLKALADSKAILEKERDLLAGKAGRQKELAELAGQIALNEQQAAGVVVAANLKVLEVKDKQVRASEAVYQAQREEDAAAQTAEMLKNAAARLAGEKAVLDYAKSIDESNAFTEFEISLMGKSAQGRALAIEQYLIQAKLKKELIEIDKNPGFDEEQRAAARVKATEAAQRAMAGATNKAYLEEWKKTTDSIEQSLTDALMRGFESGKGFGENLKDTFKNISKTLVLKPVLEVATKPASEAIGKLTTEFGKFVAAQLLGNQQVVAAKVAGDQTVMASTQATVGVEVAASQTKATAKASEAVVNQGGGDPWTAFFRIAAMAALMAAMGYAVKGASSGGSMPVTNTGTGTVFGDPSAKSASIANSLELLAESSMLGLRYSAQMTASLKNIESAMTGVTSLLLRSGNLDGVTANLRLGDLAAPRFGSTDWRAINSIGLDPISAITGKNGLFGKKATLMGTGIVGGPQSLSDIESLGFTGNYYADVQTKSKFFGITTSTKNSTILDPLDKEMARQISLIFAGIGDSVEAAAGALDLNLASVKERLAGYIVDIGKIDLKGLNGTEIQAKLSAVFGAEADKIAESVIPGFERIQQVGEGYFETLIRAAHQVEVVDLALGRMGLALEKVATSGDSMLDKALETLLGAPGVRRAVTIDSLVQQFGDLETFGQVTDDFYRSFWSQTDQTRGNLDLLTRSLAGLGFELPTSTRAFRDLVTGLDLTTESGRQAFQVLTTLGPTFADLQDSLLSAAGIGVEDLASTLRDALAGRVTGDELGKDLGDTIIGGIKDAVINAGADQIAQAFSNVILQPLLQSILTSGAVTAAVSRAQIDEVVATATKVSQSVGAILKDPGFLSAMQGVQSAISGITGAMGGLTSAAQSAQAAMNALPGVAGSYVQNGVTYQVGNAADLAAEKIKGTTTALTDAASAWKSIGDTITGEIDRIRGVLRGTGPAGEAASLAQFTVLTGQARAGDQDAAKQLASASQAYLTLAMANAGSRLEQQLALGQIQESLLDTRKILAAQFGFSLPSFDIGTNYVPRDMTARIHQGEAIVPRAYNPAAGGAGAVPASQELLKEVVERLKKLEEHAEGTRTNTAKAFSLWSDVTNEGQAMLTEAA